MQINEVSGQIVDAVMKVHSVLGPDCSRRHSNLIPGHEAQLLSQIKLGDYRVGLLINFSVARLKDGIVRKVHRL